MPLRQEGRIGGALDRTGRRSARSPGASMALGCSVGGAACGTKADHRAATDSADDDGQSTDVQHLVHQVSCMDAPCTDADDSRSKTFESTEAVGPLRTRLHLLRSGWRRASDLAAIPTTLSRIASCASERAPGE